MYDYQTTPPQGVITTYTVTPSVLHENIAYVISGPDIVARLKRTRNADRFQKEIFVPWAQQESQRAVQSCSFLVRETETLTVA